MARLARIQGVIACSFLACVLPPSLAWADDGRSEVFETMSAARLNRILTSLELKFIEADLLKDTNVIEYQDVRVFLTYGGEVLSARVFFTCVAVTDRHLNEWNRRERCARTFFDVDRSLVFFSSHSLQGGVTEKNVKHWIREYLSGLERFQKHITRDEGAKLERKVTVGPVDKTVPLYAAIVLLSNKFDVVLEVDWEAFEKAGMSKILLEPFGGLAAQKDVPVKEVLEKLLWPVRVTYQAKKDQILIVPANRAEK